MRGYMKGVSLDDSSFLFLFFLVFGIFFRFGNPRGKEGGVGSNLWRIVIGRRAMHRARLPGACDRSMLALEFGGMVYIESAVFVMDCVQKSI